MLFYQTKKFLKRFYRLSGHKELERLEHEIEENPEIGKVIPGTGGLRKLRWQGSGRGKRGGLRIIYYLKRKDFTILLDVYAKNEMEDLNAKEKKQLKQFIETL